MKSVGDGAAEQARGRASRSARPGATTGRSTAGARAAGAGLPVRAARCCCCYERDSAVAAATGTDQFVASGAACASSPSPERNPTICSGDVIAAAGLTAGVVAATRVREGTAAGTDDGDDDALPVETAAAVGAVAAPPAVAGAARGAVVETGAGPAAGELT